jgi:prolyl 4-hydroxylase
MAKWLHVGRYAVGHEPRGVLTQTDNPIPAPQIDCPDMDERCDGWSLAGQCYKNPVWMVGNVTHPGHCLGSCIRCDIWKAHEALQKQAKVASMPEAGSAAVETSRK